MSTISLGSPTGKYIRDLERVGENHAQRTVFVYRCPLNHRVCVRASHFQGMTRTNKPIMALPSCNSISCPQCENLPK